MMFSIGLPNRFGRDRTATWSVDAQEPVRFCKSACSRVESFADPRRPWTELCHRDNCICHRAGNQLSSYWQWSIAQHLYDSWLTSMVAHRMGQHNNKLLEKQSETADLRQRRVVRQVAAPYLVWQRFPLYPLKAMLTKISKWSRIQDSFRITPKIESLVVFAIPDIPRKFQKDPSVTFRVILLTHRQTNKQTITTALSNNA